MLELDEAGAPDLVFELGAVLARLQACRLVARVRTNLALRAAAELPFVKQIDRSGMPCAWTPRLQARARQRISRQWSARLATLARDYALETQFEQDRDTLGASPLHELARHDVLVLGSARLSGAAIHTARVGVVCRDGPADPRALSTAEALASTLRGALHVLLAHPAALPGATAAPTLVRGPRVTRELTDSSLTAIVGAARAARVQVLVLSRQDLERDGAALQVFLARPGRCVVVLP